MSELWVLYGNTYQYLQLGDKEVTIGNQLSHTITIQAFPVKPGITIVPKEGAYSVYQESQFLGTLEEKRSLKVLINKEEVTIIYQAQETEEKLYYIGNQNEVLYPNQHSKKFSLLRDKNKWRIEPSIEDVYINGEKMVEMRHLQVGDIIFTDFSSITLKEGDVISVSGKQPEHLIEMKQPTSVMKQKYPKYRRTPRMIYELPEEKVQFSFPTEETEDYGRSLWLIIAPPLMMLIVMGVVALVRPRGIFILISVAMFGTTLVTSTFQYFKEKKMQRKRKEKRKRLYTRYLETKREELQELSEKQREILYYHFPSFERMKYLTGEISERIWERNRMSNDFLHFRVGRATVPSSYEVSVQRRDMSNQEMDDLLEKSQELVAHYKQVQNVPLIIDLSEGPMGMVGKESVVKKEMQQVVGQLSFFQSYHDIRFVAIFDEAEYSSWEWMKWLPQFQLPHLYARGLIYNEQTRDQLLSSIYEILKERALDEEKEKKIYTPHFVFVVTNRQLISEHAILEYLEGENQPIGMSVIFAADTKENLSENIHTLVRYIDETQGDILIEKQKAVHKPFQIDEHATTNNERFARTLRSLDHQLGMSNSIPDKVTFMELFQKDHVSELNIENKWRENQSSRSLAVPVGLKGREDLVYLNLHEKAHGPHGLLAGTTGSGKSEFLQTFILSLAVHFHPYEVAFLLIDYKGGGMAQPFKNMPHLLGTITNIEGSKNFSKRALESIKSELKRRQHLFDQYEVNHINDYTELYKEGEAKNPLPHLFLISDEFAELKSEEPDFIRELVSAARIGRSLGVHLILATQKPGGVIDDQIWSNSRFKVALKVQDDSDSNEILKNGDAAKITVTGRGYLQVGNNEVYELFQSAWSGAPYSKDAFGTEDEVALVTDLGLIPLSDVASEDTGKRDKKTEIDAIVEEITTVQQHMGIEKLRSPWLPPLGHRIVMQTTEDTEENQYPIGLVDEPEKQKQSVYHYQLMDDGNVGIFGSSGYGKSTTMLTLLMQLAARNTPEEVQYYIFDFGNGALLPLQQLPHTGDYFRSDDERKIEKFLTFISEEMEKRKQLFRDYEVSNIKMYNTIVPEKLPAIFISIDNFDLVKEEMMEIENRFTQISRDGQSLGIYTILTATRTNAVKHALMSNLKTKIVHYLMDTSEKFAVIGRTPYDTEAIPGRVYIKKDEAYLAQIYLPVAGENDVEVLENMKSCVQELKEKYRHTVKPRAIPMLPRKLNIAMFYKNYHVQQTKNRLAIGLDEDSVMPVYLDFENSKHCLIVGEAQKGKTNVLQLMINGIKEGTDEVQIGLFDSINRSLIDYAEDEQITYLETKDHISTWLADIQEEFTKRKDIYVQASRERKTASLAFSPIVLMIDGMGNFQQTIDTLMQPKIAELVKNYSHLGFSIIVSGSANEFSKGFDPFTNEVKQIKQAILLMKKSDQNLLTLPYTRNEQDIQAGFGYYVQNGKAKKIQIPHYDAERVVTI
ncbi:type VII secretion protein EssC [Oceanobacillus halophilus]|uniref:Type VII secretion protein EssC n=1 Tax=Oceanobacillus halophilus TaxID=930130 RepID=A0A495A375_9BACI|nr:type VII secretion protein EssC [Oceanobacillus halophilus]RKQ33908.1 type VII secretion protein EssC [Oceanobacillus halophilus]